MRLTRERRENRRRLIPLTGLAGGALFLIAAAQPLSASAPLPLLAADDAQPVSDVPNSPPTSAQELPETVPAQTPPQTAPPGPANAQNSNNTGTANSDNTSNGQGLSLAPDAPGPANTQNPNSPLLPNQGVNTSPLYTSPSAYNGEPSALTTPFLYSTGVFDLSTVAANNALAGAFLQTALYSSEPTENATSPLDRIRIGPIDLKTTLNFSVVSDDNIGANSAPQDREKDIEFALTPAILLEYGTHEGQRGYASVVYAPTLERYYHHSNNDADNQNVAVNLQYPFERLTLNATEAYSQVSGINIDSRVRTVETNNVASGGGSYQIDDKISASSHFIYTNTSYSNPGGDSQNSGGINEQRSEIDNSANYQATEKLNFGPAFNIGFDKPVDNPQQTFEQALVGANYQMSEKLGFFGQAGVEFRQYNDGGGDQTNPIFSLGVTYTPTTTTAFTLNAFREVAPSSAVGEQTDVNTGLSAAASELLFQRLLLSFTFFYTHTDYTDNASNVPTIDLASGVLANANNSSQDNLVYRPSITYIANEWVSFALYYQYQDSSSSTPGESYHDNQMGISVTGQF